MNSCPFDASESLAVARLLWMLISSDSVESCPRSDYFDQTLQALNISSETFENFLPEPLEKSYEVVRLMPAVKRRECGRLLRLAIGSDKQVELSSLSRLNEIIQKASILRPDTKNVKKMEGGF